MRDMSGRNSASGPGAVRTKVQSRLLCFAAFGPHTRSFSRHKVSQQPPPDTLQLLTRSCIARGAVLEMVSTPSTSIRYVTFPDNSTLVGHAVVAPQKVERCKRSRRRSRNTIGDFLANGNCIGCHLSNLIGNLAPLRALVADHFEAAGALVRALMKDRTRRREDQSVEASGVCGRSSHVMDMIDKTVLE